MVSVVTTYDAHIVDAAAAWLRLQGEYSSFFCPFALSPKEAYRMQLRQWHLLY